MYDKGVLADLAAVIEDLDVPFDGESLEQAIALRDRLHARIAQAAGTFEANGWWAGDASASFVAWLRALPMCAQAYEIFAAQEAELVYVYVAPWPLSWSAPKPKSVPPSSGEKTMISLHSTPRSTSSWRAEFASATTSWSPRIEPGAISRCDGRSPNTIAHPEPRGVSWTTCMCSVFVSWSRAKPTWSR